MCPVGIVCIRSRGWQLYFGVAVIDVRFFVVAVQLFVCLTERLELELGEELFPATAGHEY